MFLTFPALGDSKLRVVTTTTDLAWAAKEIGKTHVDVVSLLKGTENPHFVDTIPDYIRQVAEAKVVCLVGLDLEIGWMPKVLSRSGNGDVQPGGKGYCETGRGVSVLEKPTGAVDRSMGDIHPSGNPHYWLSPSSLADGATEIRDTLIRVDPANAKDYTANYLELKKSLNTLHAENLAKLKPLLAKASSTPVMEYHKEFTYLFHSYGLRSFGSLEEKPGIPPSAGRIAEVSLSAKSAGVKVALAGPYAPKSTLKKFTELSSIPVALLPTSVQPNGIAKDYPALQKLLVGELVRGLSKPPPPAATP